MLKKLFIVFKVVVILNLFVCLINKEWTATFICLFNFILFFLADVIKKKLNYGNLLQLLIYLFLIGSLLGGEVYFLYVRFKHFDTVMHVLSSFIISGLAFYFVKLFKEGINGILFVIFIFSFAMMVASLWEVTEFSIDRFFDNDMQKDTIITEINSSLLSTNGKAIVKKKIENMRIGEYNINGYIDIGLYDTIEDMICAVFGSLAFIVFGRLKRVF